MKNGQTRDGIRVTGRIFAWFSALTCLLPVLIVFSVATTKVWQQGPWSGGFTLKWLIDGWKTISPYAFYSIRLAFLILLLNYIIGLPTSWVIARHRFPGRTFLYSMTNVPIAIPGIAMGLALIITYPMLRKNGTLLVVGHLLYTLPYFISNITPQLADASLRDIETVAQTLGANFIKRFVFIIIPKIKTSILAATILVVTLSLGEFNVAFFLFNPKTKPLPVELYSSYITGRIEFAAAITLCFLCFVIPAGILLERLGGIKVGNKNVG
ncbi:ABC transporter permease subunit [Treponema sp. OMZ 840]|uniref:ABC transporter permease n=1 Tax=Treponema sp. OMZ 840 TaxID=244313 RepID=UPI003D8BAEAF